MDYLQNEGEISPAALRKRETSPAGLGRGKHA